MLPPAVSNSIIWNNTDNLSGCIANYSCIDGDDGQSGVYNLDSNPQFTDPNNYDFHILNSSPCVDSGDPNQSYTDEIDIDFHVRVINRIDIGADEVSGIYNSSRNLWYASLQHCIEMANTNDVIILYPGLYAESIDYLGKNLVITGIDPNDSDIIADIVIEGTDDVVVNFANNETSDSVICGITITGGITGIYCDGSAPTIAKCVIYDNDWFGIECDNYAAPSITNSVISDNYGYGVYNVDSSPDIINCTIVGHVIGIHNTTGSISNCILWSNDINLKPMRR